MSNHTYNEPHDIVIPIPNETFLVRIEWTMSLVEAVAEPDRVEGVVWGASRAEFLYSIIGAVVTPCEKDGV